MWCSVAKCSRGVWSRGVSAMLGTTAGDELAKKSPGCFSVISGTCLGQAGVYFAGERRALLHDFGEVTRSPRAIYLFGREIKLLFIILQRNRTGLWTIS